MGFVERENTTKSVIGRAYVILIENFSNTELKRVLEKHVSEKLEITTDKWTGYSPSKENYNITQILSKKWRKFSRYSQLNNEY